MAQLQPYCAIEGNDDGLPVVFVHGMGVDHRSLMMLDKAFDGNDSIRRIYLDLPGFGRTPALPEHACGLPEMADWLQTAIDGLVGKAAPFAMVGNKAMRILNLYSKYNGRVTGEMLDRNTYNLETGEWKQVSDEYLKLEAEALRQYISLKPEYKDAYKQLILFPVQAMANLYEMYYAQAMNHKLYKENNPQANEWADKVEQAFARDKALSDDYNNVMSGGKWKNMMIQKHIGYTSWNDNFPADTLPQTYRIEHPEKAVGGYVFTGQDGYVAMEAEHYYSTKAAPSTEWTVIPYMGRTLSGMALMPYTQPTDGASISYKIKLPKGVDKVTVHVIVKSTLAFHDRKGHEYSIGFEGAKEQTINFNQNLNELPENVYSIYYPTVARRIVEKKVKLNVPNTSDGMQTLIFKPLDPGIVLEKLVVDYGGYKKSYLFMNESKSKRDNR